MDYETCLNLCVQEIINADGKTELYVNLGLSNIADMLSNDLSHFGWKAYYDGEGFYTLKKL